MAEKTKRDWVVKLHESKGLPKIDKVRGKMSQRWGAGTFVIPAPVEVDELMRKVPQGKIVTINVIRQALARKHKTNFTCPLTTGIFAWIAANAAAQERQEGKKQITPYWRTLKTGGILNPKYPGGAEAQKKLLEKEGHKVVAKGKKFVVENYGLKVQPFKGLDL